MSRSRAAACIRRNKNFLITTHTNPEGDALGSELAIWRLLRTLGKRAAMVNGDPVPCTYAFLPGTGSIRRFNREPARACDCFVVLDCTELSRSGRASALASKSKLVLNIDHHISNKQFGDVNWVEAGASSTAEMIFKLYKELRVPFDREAALLLYVGMMTDTGSFRYANTADSTHRAVAELLKHRLDIPDVYRRIYENVAWQDMQLLSSILPMMRRDASGRVAWVELQRGLFKKGMNPCFDIAEHILSFGRAIQGVEVVALFRENLKTKNEVRVNLRSQGKVDVNKVAQAFGGGGHRTASGCTVTGSLAQVRKKLLSKIGTVLAARQKCPR